MSSSKVLDTAKVLSVVIALGPKVLCDGFPRGVSTRVYYDACCLALEKSPPKGCKTTLRSESYAFHLYTSDQGCQVTAVCLADRDMGTKLPYALVKDALKKFNLKYPVDQLQILKTLAPDSLSDTFGVEVLNPLIERCNAVYGKIVSKGRKEDMEEEEDVKLHSKRVENM